MTEPTRLTGLFLGAGASVEVGMPLVVELTEELKNWLTPAKLKELNASWLTQGTGFPDLVINDFAAVLTNDEMHYESLLGYLETQYRRRSPHQQQYHGIYSWLVEMVAHILRLRHTNNVAYIENNIGLLEGIAKLAAVNAPLWVFSLNHDVLIECVAAKYAVPLHSGFSDGIVTFPRRDASGAKIGQLRGETLTAAQLERGMIFPPPGSQGINLLKIHGALDVFTFRDGKDLVKLMPDEATIRSTVDALRVAQEELIYVDPRLPHPVKATNEIAYADDEGVMQFLRRSMLAGAYKFDNCQTQVLPQRILQQFAANLNFVSTLVCIGYGFGDLHINQVLRDWLERKAERRLEIVSPGGTNVPSFLLHLSPQVQPIAATASDYLDRVTGILRSRRENAERRLSAWFRKNRNVPDGQQKVVSFMQQITGRSMQAILERVKALPFRDGDLDCGTLGKTPEELAQEFISQNGISYEELLEEFLQEVQQG